MTEADTSCSLQEILKKTASSCCFSVHFGFSFQSLISEWAPGPNNNNRLHLQFVWSRRCDDQRVLTHLSPALNSSVFTGDPVDPDKQTSVFEYQQHVSTARDCSCARVLVQQGTLMMHGALGKKKLKNFNMLFKHQLTKATCVVQRCLIQYSNLACGGLCYRGDKVTHLSCFLSTSLWDSVRLKPCYC